MTAILCRQDQEIFVDHDWYHEEDDVVSWYTVDKLCVEQDGYSPIFGFAPLWDTEMCFWIISTRY